MMRKTILATFIMTAITSQASAHFVGARETASALVNRSYANAPAQTTESVNRVIAFETEGQHNEPQPYPQTVVKTVPFETEGQHWLAEATRKQYVLIDAAATQTAPGQKAPTAHLIPSQAPQATPTAAPAALLKPALNAQKEPVVTPDTLRQIYVDVVHAYQLNPTNANKTALEIASVDVHGLTPDAQQTPVATPEMVNTPDPVPAENIMHATRFGMTNVHNPDSDAHTAALAHNPLFAGKVEGQKAAAIMEAKAKAELAGTVAHEDSQGSTVGRMSANAVVTPAPAPAAAAPTAILNPVSTIAIRVADETTRAKAAEQANTSAIDGNKTAIDTNKINITKINGDIQTVGTKVNDETTARKADVASLTTKIDANSVAVKQEVSDRSAAVNSIATTVVAEEAARKAGDDALRNDVDANKTAAAAAQKTADAAVSKTDFHTAQDAQNKTLSDVGVKASDNGTAIATNKTAIAANTAAVATKADQSTVDAINATVKSNTTTISTTSQSVQKNTSAIAGNTTNITNNTTNITNNTTDITALQASQTKQDGEITTNATGVAGNKSAIATETSRAAAAEQANTTAIAGKADTTALKADEQDISRNKSAIAANTRTETNHFTTLSAGVKQAQDTGAYAQARAEQAFANADANRRALDHTNQQVAANSKQLANHEARIQDLEANNQANFNKLESQQNKDRKEYRAGIAGAYSFASIPQAPSDQTAGLGMGVGTFNGQNAIAAGVSARVSTNLSVKTGVTWDTQGNVGAGAGFLVSY